LRLFWKVFLETSKIEKVEKVPISMSISMIILSVTVIILGVWPAPIIELISTALSS
jgi:formate hydrogenlyase subunit 3/multisubunit Na+/H+ antiporter MnhD subunit